MNEENTGESTENIDESDASENEPLVASTEELGADETIQEARKIESGGGALLLAAIGIVFGDIGTSPLYAMKETFNGHHRLAIDQASIYGVISLITWSILVIVSLKYVTLIMRADNEGEGGIMALISLVRGEGLKSSVAKMALVTLGIFGASLFYGDGVITPAISVLSAVEGVQVIEPSFKPLVIPITLVILITLFSVQRRGTESVGKLFGPITTIWFLVLTIMGLFSIAGHPEILKALSPWYAINFIREHQTESFFALGSVVLAVTGAEALYADMGHFGRSIIQRAWFFLVFPALILNYMGQGALLLEDPKAIENPFYYLAPVWGQVPLLLLATCATVIASQAVITGAFSVTRQAVQLGFLPRLLVKQTSNYSYGQIYVPAVNWLLLVSIITVVLLFKSSSGLASAYGIAVTGTLAIDTILFFVVVRVLWSKPLWLTLAGAMFFLFIDLAFFTANMTKFFSGGWLPIVIAAALFTALHTWWRGSRVTHDLRASEEGSIIDFVYELHDSPDPPHRVSGSAVFLHPASERVPLAMRYNVLHNHVLHELVLIVQVNVEPVPFVDPSERMVLDDAEIPDDGIYRICLRYGYQEKPNVPAALSELPNLDIPFYPDDATYFLSRMHPVVTNRPGMANWRKRIYTSMNRVAAPADIWFNLPEDRVVSLGSNLEF